MFSLILETRRIQSVLNIQLLSVLSRTGQGIELMFLGIGLGDQDVFINKAIAR